MKELRDWLQWATTETHVSADERAERSEELSTRHCITQAAGLITVRASGRGRWDDNDEIAYCLTHHPEPFRRLCLAFADAVEKMREEVAPVATQTIHPPLCTAEHPNRKAPCSLAAGHEGTHYRESCGEWIEPAETRAADPSTAIQQAAALLDTGRLMRLAGAFAQPDGGASSYNGGARVYHRDAHVKTGHCPFHSQEINASCYWCNQL